MEKAVRDITDCQAVYHSIPIPSLEEISKTKIAPPMYNQLSEDTVILFVLKNGEEIQVKMSEDVVFLTSTRPIALLYNTSSGFYVGMAESVKGKHGWHNFKDLLGKTLVSIKAGMNASESLDLDNGNKAK